MSDNFSIKPSVWFWVFAVLFVLWGIMGCSMYLLEMMMSDEAYAEAFGAELAEVRDVYPVWGIAGYAMAVWSGLLASILFILRRRLSSTLFIVSIVAAIIGFIPSFTIPALRDAAGPGFWVMPLIVVALGAFEVFYSRKQAAKGILR